MIEFLSNWAEQIIVAVVIATIIEMILPDNNNKKYIKIVIGIYIVFVIIHPFISSDKKINFNEINENTIKVTTSEETVNQASMDERLQELYEEQIEKDITNKVEQEGYIVKKCDVDVELNANAEDKGIKKIVLKIDKNIKERDDNYDSAKNETVNKIEIKVGINKYIKKEEKEEKINSAEINKLKTTLSEYYQIESKKISITKD